MNDEEFSKNLIQGDSLQVLKTIDANSIDSLVTDPPAGISFMNKEWDKAIDFIQSMTEIYRECLRVLKPGAYGLVWAIPRTSHWTATSLEQAGFEIRDVITHIFGSGFPKSLDVSKAIDKMHGAEREIVGEYKRPDGTDRNYDKWNNKKDGDLFDTSSKILTSPYTSEAKQWQGWGTALKPASEHWILVRKPLGESTVAKNVLKHGTGALNIDASRVSGSVPSTVQGQSSKQGEIYGRDQRVLREFKPNAQGRFPANLVLSHNEDCEEQCTEGCAAAMLDEQSGVSISCDKRNGDITESKARSWKNASTKGIARTGYIDIGGASRFFYCAKASKKDRGLDNKHPTVKATKLMEYLIRLITPTAGTVLDPFMGSGSTGVAAKALGMGFIGIEKEVEYFEIAEKRI